MTVAVWFHVEMHSAAYSKKMNLELKNTCFVYNL